MENRHEAIISRPQFDIVQQILREDTRAGAEQTAVHSYCGRIFCGDCGAPMVRKTVNSGGKRYVYYVCSANKADRAVCSKHSIREDTLDQAVLVTVQQQIRTVLDMDRAMQQIEALSWEKSEIKKLEANMEYQSQVIEKNNVLRLGVYEDLRAGILTREEFLTLKEEFSARIDEAKQVLDQLIRDKSNIQQGLSEQQSWLSQFRKYKNIAEISRLVVVHLIEQIRVFEDSEIEVVFRQRDQFADIMDFLKKQQADQEAILCSKQEVV